MTRTDRDADGSWFDVVRNVDDWMDWADYRIKPTPHPNADLLRALADDQSFPVKVIEITYNSIGNATKFLLSEIK